MMSTGTYVHTSEKFITRSRVIYQLYKNKTGLTGKQKIQVKITNQAGTIETHKVEAKITNQT